MEKPRLIVFAGPNGSGKTSITEQLREHQWLEGCIFINPDEIAEREFGGWNSEEAAIEAANKAQQLREKALVEGTSLAFETVLSTDDKLDFIARAKDAGYFVRVFFVSTTHPAINASRITFRYMDGGHEVRISKIVSRYFKSIVNCDALANWVDRLYVFDNSVDRQEPRLLFRTRDGRLSKCYCDESETPEWALKIRQNLPG
ncbi:MULTISPECIES: zeta toxin family protein [Pseudomonas]|uniref:zeta toxin family protein n=1 Tax=Pseudomonas TaxID=286 RepID=UPI0002A29B32|nr:MULTISPECIES: zeta toxin family protein [Pseudomonas]KRV81335.1 AAA family ATPase [Pseudomonas citronellolis]KRW76147.1 AAA family ATPase [Pseudomonas citronellolis]MBB1608182.1 AAA family ATPase [Pseudomonas sp. UMC76]MBB1639226.1 AAA family ATPase [Pseudomonas sp. UME83]NTX88756.1 AAA family ATPase [Pseudomonas sp. UMA643]